MPAVQWWQRGTVYQIYPLSFQDTDGDGQGDINGIRRRLGYLNWLGIDAIWISPVYPSPMADFGYDIADHCAVDPRFGTLEDFETLVREAHARNIKVILDFVPNHTSDAHPWFQDSRSSRTSPKRDWYVWRDPAPDGGAPNNWVSNFGGSAWELDRASGQYYYHAFLKEQPDLNWRNPEVREAMYDVLRFWFERGVDGFRIDVLWCLVKDEQFRDNPPSPGYREGDPASRSLIPLFTTDRPELFDILHELRSVADAYPQRVLIGEIYLPIERLVAYYGEGSRKGVHLPFNFQLIQVSWQAAGIARIVTDYERLMQPHMWPNWVLGNHDNRRIASRVGAAQARVAAMMLLTFRGTPTLYYGDEIGMEDVAVPAQYVRDGWAKNEPGIDVSRDPQRTPMQWDASDHAGFTSGAPWLPLEGEHRRRNVEALRDDPKSMLTLYRRLIALRRASPALSVGGKRMLAAPEDVIAFERAHANERYIVVLNLGREPRRMELEAHAARVVLSTHLDRDEQAVGPGVDLRADEVVVLRAQ